MERRDFFRSLGLSMAGVAGSQILYPKNVEAVPQMTNANQERQGLRESNQPDRRPNFLIIMMEQTRGDCLGLEGHPVLLTPNLDSIGAGGVHFTSAYSTCPICVPARRSFLTGQFPYTHGMLHNTNNREWDSPTFAGELRKAGYHTVWIGRSHHQRPSEKRYGFDHMVLNYSEWLNKNQPEGAAGASGTGVMANDWTARSWPMDDSLHQTQWIVNEALSFLKWRDPSCPFCAVVSFHAAHPPLVAPAFYMERYLRTGVPDPVIGDWAVPPTREDYTVPADPTGIDLKGELLLSARAGYYGLINHLDDQIRRLLHPRFGVNPRNTVIMLCSDHGEMLGDHYLWWKSKPYEGAARVPFLIRAPRGLGIKPGRVIDKPVSLEDIMPTVLDMAGVDIPDTVDGRSLLPMLRGEEKNWRPWNLIEFSHLFKCLTDGREKYIWFNRDGREQFFDLVEDPKECHDLINKPERAERIAWWRAQLVEELKDRPEGYSDGKRLIPGRPIPPRRS